MKFSSVMEVQFIKSKFTSVGYPLPFMDNVIRTFKEDNIVDQNNVIDDNDDDFVKYVSFY